MIDIQCVDEEDVRHIVETECEFRVEDQGIGYYEWGDGKYTDKDLRLSLTTQEIVVQYPIDTDSVIFTRVIGTYYQSDEYGEYECGWMAELSHIEYDQRGYGCFEATYEVNED